MNIIKIKKKRKIFTCFIVCAILFFSLSILISIPFTVSANADLLGKEAESPGKKYVAITFDDGPHPAYTQKILDILEEKKVPATFFVVGFRAELHPNALKRMKELNCEIGNHTYNHIDLSDISKSKILSEIEKCNETIFAAIGEYPILYRPPFGRIRKENEKCISLRKILWTVDSLDWNTKNKDKVIKNVVKNVKDGSIVLMHDFYDSTIHALPEIIDILTEEGFEFKTVSELAALQKISKLHDYFLNS